jgi:hypothetical protein
MDKYVFTPTGRADIFEVLQDHQAVERGVLLGAVGCYQLELGG